MKIVITGSSGFVGSNIFYDLHKKKKYFFYRVSRNDIDIILNNQDEKIKNLKEKIFGASTIIHCAGLAHKPKKIFNNQQINKVNVDLAVSLFKLASDLKIKKFIFISTSKVMGESNDPLNPFNENDTTNPSDVYSSSKLKAEEKLYNLSKINNVELTIIRPPLIYGPGVKGNFLKLIKLINNNKFLPIDNEQCRRSYLSTLNLSNAIDTIINYNLDPVNTFFISDDNDISLKDLSKNIAKCLNVRLRYIKIPDFFLKYFVKIFFKKTYYKLFSSFNINVYHFKNKTGWEPVKNDNTLQKTIDYYNKK